MNNLLSLLLSALLLFVGVQQREDGHATIVIVVRGDGPASFASSIPAGWDVVRRHASTGLLSDDADPRGTPPSVVRWSGVVSDTAPILVWIELLALPGAKSGAVVVSGEGQTVTCWVRAPGEVAPDPLKKLWLPWIRR